MEERAFDQVVLRNTRQNELFVDITKNEGKDSENDDDEDAEPEQETNDLDDEDDEIEDDGEPETETSLKEQNERLKDQLRLKELYIKQLENRLRELEVQKSQETNTIGSLTSPVRKRNK